MVLWFAGLALVLVAVVFDSPNLDYRMVMVGAVAPAGESVLGGPWLGHTLAGPVLVFALIAVVARGRRLVQRRLIGLPIGWFVHLVLDGTWTDPDRFWWPVTGWAFGGTVPEAQRSIGVLVTMEVAGSVALVWGARRFGLVTSGALKRFTATGHLPPPVSSRRSVR